MEKQALSENTLTLTCVYITCCQQRTHWMDCSMGGVDWGLNMSEALNKWWLSSRKHCWKIGEILMICAAQEQRCPNLCKAESEF